MEQIPKLDKLILELDDNKVAWTEKWKIIELKKQAELFKKQLETFTTDEIEILLPEVDAFMETASEVVDKIGELK